MRVIFRLNKGEDYSVFEDWMREHSIGYVQRFIVFSQDIHRVYIVDANDFHYSVVPTEWLAMRYTWFEVTACNKQYITEHRWGSTPRPLGSMCQVTAHDALDHVFDRGAPYGNWYLIDTETGNHWIAANRNPDRVGNHTSPGVSDDMALWPRDPRCPEPLSGAVAA